jgi:hypothetical protein
MSDTAFQTDARETLFVTDAELIRRIGVPEKIARYTIRELDSRRGADWPKKQGIWGNRRYWPAVRAYLDRHGGLK